MTTIANHTDYQITMAEIEKYLQKGFSNLTANDEEELGRLSIMVQQYEAVHFPVPVVKTAIHRRRMTR